MIRKTKEELQDIKNRLIAYVETENPHCKMKDLAEKFGISAGTVSRWLLGAGISSPTTRQTKVEMAKTRDWLIEMVKVEQPSCSMECLARQVKVSSATVSKWFKEAGISRWY